MTATPTQAPAPPGRLWPVSEASELLRVSPNTLRRLANLKQIASVRVGKKLLLTDAAVRSLADGSVPKLDTGR